MTNTKLLDDLMRADRVRVGLSPSTSLHSYAIFLFLMTDPFTSRGNYFSFFSCFWSSALSLAASLPHLFFVFTLCSWLSAVRRYRTAFNTPCETSWSTGLKTKDKYVSWLTVSKLFLMLIIILTILIFQFACPIHIACPTNRSWLPLMGANHSLFRNYHHSSLCYQSPHLHRLNLIFSFAGSSPVNSTESIKSAELFVQEMESIITVCEASAVFPQ